MTTDDRTSYLESGTGGDVEGTQRLDLIRDALNRAETWSEPPPGLFEGIVKGATTGDDPEPARGPRGLEPGIAMAAALAVVLVGLVAWLGANAPEDGDMVVAMAGTELAPAARGEARLSETPSGWYIRLELQGLPPAPDGSFYEGWLWHDGEGVSIGTFHMRQGSDPVAMWSGVSPHDFPTVRVTLEDLEGGHGPSDRVMMAGTMLDD